MKLRAKNQFLILASLAPVLATVLVVSRNIPNPGKTESHSQKRERGRAVPNPLVRELEWDGFLKSHPRLETYRESLMKLAPSLPVAKFEALEPAMQDRLAQFADQRENSVHPRFSICWEPGVSPGVIEAFHAVEESSGDEPGDIQAATQFEEGGRWGRTATFNSIRERREQGKPTTLRWSFIPDDTSIFGFNGEPTSDSDLISFLDDLYGESGGADLTTRKWFAVFQAAFDNISRYTGVSYVYEPNDDGADLTQTSLPSGSIGVRGDIRIGGHFIDGDSGSNILAYNFSPSAGDMVIDTSNISVYEDLSEDSLNLRNVVEHEHTHGLALDHVCPINETKLMEPIITRQFRGLQLDDIFSLNRLYGDFFEKHNSNRNNDSTDDAAVLPLVPETPYSREFLSIDDDSDSDFFLLENVPAGSSVTFRVIPVSTPGGFREGAQNPDGTCSPGSLFDFTSIHDLEIAILASNGRTVLSESTSGGLGDLEEIVDFEVSGSGNYYLQVTGSSADNCQLYTLEVSVETSVSPSPYSIWAAAESLPEDRDGPGQDADDDGIFNVQEYYFGLSPLEVDDRINIEVGPGPEEADFLLTYFRDPTAQVDEVVYETSNDLQSWSEFIPPVDGVLIEPAEDLEKVTLTIPAGTNPVYVRIGVTQLE